jgi:hypothetical protein
MEDHHAPVLIFFLLPFLVQTPIFICIYIFLIIFLSLQICTLKVDITCCDKCPIKLKKKLMKTNGMFFQLKLDRAELLLLFFVEIDLNFV